MVLLNLESVKKNLIDYMRKIILIITVVVSLLFIVFTKYYERGGVLFDKNDMYSIMIENNSSKMLYVALENNMTHAYLIPRSGITYFFYIDEKGKGFPICIYDGDIVKKKGTREECNAIFLMEYDKVPIIKGGKGFIIAAEDDNKFILKTGEINQEDAKRFFDITRWGSGSLK